MHFFTAKLDLSATNPWPYNETQRHLRLNNIVGRVFDVVINLWLWFFEDKLEANNF